MRRKSDNEFWWEREGLPHKGWNWERMEDLGEDSSTVCMMCGHPDVRFVHYLSHPDLPWLDDFGVGCVCAEKLTEDYEGELRGKERAWKNRMKRLATFRRRPWCTWSARNGFPERRTLRYRGVDVVAWMNGTRNIHLVANYGRLRADDRAADWSSAVDRAFALAERLRKEAGR